MLTKDQNDLKRMQDGRRVDLLAHVRTVLDENPDVVLYVGTDSHNRLQHGLCYCRCATVQKERRSG